MSRRSTAWASVQPPSPYPAPPRRLAPAPIPDPYSATSALQDPTLVKAVDRWLATEEHPQSERNDLRNIVFNAVRRDSRSTTARR